MICDRMIFIYRILRLKEVGLWDALVDRMLEEKRKNNYDVVTTEAIGIDQVFLIILILCCGIVLALIIFIIEKVVYACKLKVNVTTFRSYTITNILQKI